MRHVNFIYLSSIFAILLVVMAVPVQAEDNPTNTKPITIAATPSPVTLLPKEQAKGFQGIIDNLIAGVKQQESSESAAGVRFQAAEKSAAQRNDDLMAGINKDLHHLEQMLTNLHNEAPKSRAMEAAALGAGGQTTSVKGHAKSYMNKLLAGYQGETNQSPTANSLVGGLNLAVAEACDAGCVSPKEAEAISSGSNPKIPCHSDPEVAGSWTDPTKLNAMADGPSKCIDASANSKAMKCMGAFMHLMSVSEDAARGDKFNPAQAIKVGMAKNKVADYAGCKLSKIIDNVCLPQSAGNDQSELQAKKDVAKKYGVNCVKDGSNPSPSCERQLKSAVLKAGMGETAKGQNTAPGQKVESMNGLMNTSMGLAAEGEKAASEGGASCGDANADGVTQRVEAFLDREDVRTYMASAEFGKNVKIEMAWLPTMYGKVQYAMNEWTRIYDNQHPYVMMADVWIKDFNEEQAIQYAQNRQRQIQQKTAALQMLNQPRSCNIAINTSVAPLLASVIQQKAVPISAKIGQ